MKRALASVDVKRMECCEPKRISWRGAGDRADVNMDASDSGAGAESAKGDDSHGKGGDGIGMVAGDDEGGVKVQRWCAERWMAAVAN